MQLKKLFSILFALLIGIVIVFFAWRSGTDTQTEGGSLLVDSTNWRDSLIIAPQEYSVGAITTPGKNINFFESEATTTTTALGQKLLIEYIAAQTKSADGTISDAEATRIANLLAQEVSVESGKQYTLRDINTFKDESANASVTYIYKVGSIVDVPLFSSQNENELNLVISLMNNEDSSSTTKLQEKADLYKKLVDELLKVKTPSPIAVTHLRLIQACETLRSAALGLQNATRDPAAGITALAQYKNGIDEIIAVRDDYGIYFAKLLK